jgi:hypothetical protein
MRFSSQILYVSFSMVFVLSTSGQRTSKSPFERGGLQVTTEAPPKTSTTNKKAAPLNPIANEIEMRGYFQLSGVYYFSIHQKKIISGSKTKKSEWVRKGEEAFGEFSVKDFIPESMTLVMTRSGQSETEEILLHESQWNKAPATGKKNNSRIPSPLSRGSKAKPSGLSRSPVTTTMPRKPDYIPPLPPSSTAGGPQRGSSKLGSPVGSSGSGSYSSGSSGFIPRAYLPSRVTSSPVPTTAPSASAGAVPPATNLPEGGPATVAGPSPGLLIPTDSTTGEIDLDSLPPPPPPPNILPPGPPPNIEPDSEDR